MFRRAVTILTLFLCLAAIPSIPNSSAGQELVWRNGTKVDASIPGWPLKKVLGRLASASGWKVYVEPGLDQTVSVKFAGAAQGSALRLMLGGLNFALVPGGKEPARLYVYKTSLSEATSLVEPEKASKPKNWLANEIIVTLGPNSETDIQKLAKELGGKVVAKSDALNAYRLQFDNAEAAEAAREKLSGRDDLDLQDNYGFNRPVIASGATQSPAQMFPIDPKPVSRDGQVTVALVDTAIQPLSGKMNDFVLPAVHVAGAPDSLPSDPTHGTSMAQTILNSMAFAKGAGAGDANLGTVRVLPIDIYGNSATTTTFEVAQGLYKAIQSDAQVINLSLGGTGDSPMVEYLLEMAKQKQIMVFASAGNSPTTDPTWPAASPNALAVTATDWSGNIASYANRGSFIDLKAPGSSRVYHNGQVYISTGTSTATAFVSGQAAALAARGLSPLQTTAAIQKAFDVNQPAPQR